MNIYESYGKLEEAKQQIALQLDQMKQALRLAVQTISDLKEGKLRPDQVDVDAARCNFKTHPNREPPAPFKGLPVTPKTIPSKPGKRR